MNKQTIKLTLLEKDVLLNGFGYCCFNDNENEKGIIWSNSIIDECKICKLNQISGITSNLSKKGIIWSNGTGKESIIGLTNLGKKVFIELNI